MIEAHNILNGRRTDPSVCRGVMGEQVSESLQIAEDQCLRAQARGYFVYGSIFPSPLCKKRSVIGCMEDGF